MTRVATLSEAAGPTEYTSRIGDSVSYRLNVSVGQGPQAKSYPGKLAYQVNAKRGSLIELNVNGNVEGKIPSSFPTITFGRNRSSDRSMLPSLDRVTITGAKVGITARGEVGLSDRDESLDFFLGPLGQIAIVPLPAPGTMQWSSSNTIRVTRSSSNSWPPAIGSPFDRKRPSQDGTLADESYQYQAQLLNDGMVKVAHKYSLTAEHADPPVKVVGNGFATFDPKMGFVESLEMSRMIQASSNGAKIQIPISVTLRRETDAERQAVAEAAAAAKAKRSAPFTQDERRKWLAALTPQASRFEAVRAMGELNGRDPRP
ncbi:MAG: hypothetical protein AAF539_10400, partial [Planctomycetota bacterium]